MRRWGHLFLLQAFLTSGVSGAVLAQEAAQKARASVPPPVISRVVGTRTALLIEGAANPFEIIALVEEAGAEGPFLTQAGPDGAWRAWLERGAGVSWGRLRAVALYAPADPIWFEGRLKQVDLHAPEHRPDLDTRKEVVKERAVGTWVELGASDGSEEDVRVLYSLPVDQARQAYVRKPDEGHATVFEKDTDGRIGGRVVREEGGLRYIRDFVDAAPPDRFRNYQALSYATNREQIQVLRDGVRTGVSMTYGEQPGGLSFGSMGMDLDAPQNELLVDVVWDLKRLVGYEAEDIVVFLHGCCTSFDEAAQSVGRIASNLRLGSRPFLFSWPTHGSAWGYVGDRDMVGVSREPLLSFLEQLAAFETVRSIDVVAHSLGNHVLLEVLRDVAARQGEKSDRVKSKLRHVVFASPDVERSSFKTLANGTSGYGKSRTLYVSQWDWVLYLQTGLVSGRDRAGYVSPEGPLVLPGLDTIDVSNSYSWWSRGHRAFADELPVLNDLAIILSRGTRPPSERMPIFREKETTEGVYWYYPSP